MKLCPTLRFRVDFAMVWGIRQVVRDKFDIEYEGRYGELVTSEPRQ